MADPVFFDDNGTNGAGRPEPLSNGASHKADELDLRKKARIAIEGGKVPRRRPDGTWAGPGTGDECAICGIAVRREEVEFEIEFAREGGPPAVDRYRVHTRCFAAWEFERHSTQSP
jgi:hypothetical protein